MNILPPELPPSFEQLIDNIMLTLFAAGSGVVGYIMRQLNSDRTASIKRALIEAAGSAIIGFIAILLCRAMKLSYEWTGVIVGTLGWLGATVSIQIVEKIIRKKLGIENVDGNNVDTETNGSGSNVVHPSNVPDLVDSDSASGGTRPK